jgi:hypothetical protein
VPPDPAGSETAAARRSPRRRRITSLAFLAFGLAVAFYLSKVGPQEQHVRFVLGAAAPAVSELEIAYVTEDFEVAREARMTFAEGAAPRVVAHDPELPDGPYLLRIGVETTEGRRAAERRVTLEGGTTSVDLAGVLPRSP